MLAGCPTSVRDAARQLNEGYIEMRLRHAARSERRGARYDRLVMTIIDIDVAAAMRSSLRGFGIIPIGIRKLLALMPENVQKQRRACEGKSMLMKRWRVSLFCALKCHRAAGCHRA